MEDRQLSEAVRVPCVCERLVGADDLARGCIFRKTSGKRQSQRQFAQSPVWQLVEKHNVCSDAAYMLFIADPAIRYQAAFRRVGEHSYGYTPDRLQRLDLHSLTQPLARPRQIFPSKKE